MNMEFLPKWRFISAFVVGVLCTVIGTVFFEVWPGLFEHILNKNLALTSTSRSFELWKVTPIPMYIEFYFFNWTNPDEIRNKSSKPRLEQLGPYVFSEHREKVVEDWFNENSTVTFWQNRTWHYQPSLSNGSLDDVVSTINIPLVTAAFAVRNEAKFLKYLLNGFIRSLGSKLNVNKKVREFLFEGYKDPLIDIASLVPGWVINITLPFDKFGWFYKRNGSETYDGLFNMYTGVSDIEKFGVLGEWQNHKKTPFYESYCSMVNGSAGEFFPPNQKKGKLSLFSPDVCRTLTLTYKEEVEVDGINGYRYWGDDTMFDNFTTRPDNWCFCPSGECSPSGTIDVSSCKWGAPAFISFPHFFHADPWYREVIDGMHPNEKEHQMFIDLEPDTGIPLQVAAAMQINIKVQHDPAFTTLKNLPTIYFPAIWFKQTALIDDDIGSQIRLISKLPMIGSIVSLVILSIGVSTLVVSSIIFATHWCKKEEDETVLGTSTRSFGCKLRSKFLTYVPVRFTQRSSGLSSSSNRVHPLGFRGHGSNERDKLVHLKHANENLGDNSSDTNSHSNLLSSNFNQLV